MSFPKSNIGGIKTFSPKEIQKAKYARLLCLLACSLARSLVRCKKKGGRKDIANHDRHQTVRIISSAEIRE
jgi:hypothetical protein